MGGGFVIFFFCVGLHTLCCLCRMLMLASVCVARKSVWMSLCFPPVVEGGTHQIVNLLM